MPRTLLAVCVGLIVSIESISAQTPTPPPQLDKSSPEYHSGYADGCMHATSGFPRNNARYSDKTPYHVGWDEGFRKCYPHQTIHSNGDPNGPMKNVF